MIVAGFRLSLQEFCSLDPQVIYQLAEILDTQNSRVDIDQIRQIWTEIEDNFQGYAVKKLYDIKENKLSMLMQHLSNTQDLSKKLAQEGYNFVCAVDKVYRILADYLSAGFSVDNSWQLLDKNEHFVQNSIVDKLSIQLKQAYDDFELVDQQIAAEIFSYVKQHDNDTDPDTLVLSSLVPDDSFSFDINNASWAPLWGREKNEPKGSDVRQNSMNNCTVLATLAALADRKPNLLKNNTVVILIIREVIL